MPGTRVVIHGLLLLTVNCRDVDEHGTMDEDPVFRAARADPELRARLDSQEIQNAMADPAFRRQLRAELSEQFYRKPDVELINKVEKLLNGEPCVGSTDQWRRIYANGVDTQFGGVDPTKVRFRLVEAGKHGIVAGREIVSAKEFVVIDDRDLQVIFGSFDRNTQSINIEYCGPNSPR